MRVDFSSDLKYENRRCKFPAVIRQVFELLKIRAGSRIKERIKTVIAKINFFTDRPSESVITNDGEGKPLYLVANSLGQLEASPGRLRRNLFVAVLPDSFSDHCAGNPVLWWKAEAAKQFNIIPL